MKRKHIIPLIIISFLFTGMIYSQQSGVHTKPSTGIADTVKKTEKNENKKDAEISRLRDKSLEHFKKHNYSIALLLFSDYLLLDPGNAVILMNRAQCYEKLNKYDSSINDFGESIKINPDFNETYYHRASVYVEMKEYEKALEDLERAVKLDSTIFDCYNLKGIIYYRLGRYIESIKNFTKVIDCNTEYGNGYYNRGIVYFHIGDFTNARLDWTLASEYGVFEAYEALEKYFNDSL